MCMGYLMINIQNYKRTEEIKKLYDVPRNTVVSIATEYRKDTPFMFLNIDGMYSCCQEFDQTDYYHPAAWTEVYLWKRVPDIIPLVKKD